ncbi:hypothetical protein COCSUDRAFT_53862 [Coccomyxa subellipsoidea C-169]|uniref:Uncharacterized protein n=1 Tax=Coccomyxa subellipsoidea (strain C-169) TaxID=574566 RepID=I0YTU3_COCSC|nr:hypothetical protein COCSUDRAFT_53862 [Coccomyxa subellipsoidea C-169]EIE21812.1 hypothetical protein COCSUDRAFT_53862 [Coccomyxa subellipsoidea C-169]|eukprot:XP_005646356.1 hypothetical protein COCSUDRAFT_53862 [Coccomyxa subellipsoidea C-169]
MRRHGIAILFLLLAYGVHARRLTGERLAFPSDAEQVNHIYALIGGAPLASLGELPASPLEAPLEAPGSVPRVMDSVKSFQARSHASGGCRKLKPGRTLKQAQGVDTFPLSALSPGAWPPDASYFDQANPMLRTEALGPAVARAQTIDRLRLGGPILQQMERPSPELPTLDEAPAGAPEAQISLEFADEVDSAGQPCERLPINIFAALARDGYVNK